MDHIGKLSHGALHNESTRKAACAAFVCSEAQKGMKKIFPAEFVQHVSVVSYRNGVVYVATENPAYAQELVLKKAEILQEINNALGSHTVKDIRFRGAHLTPNT